MAKKGLQGLWKDLPVPAADLSEVVVGEVAGTTALVACGGTSLRRVAAFVATLFFVSVLVFVVIRVLPGDPALVIMGAEGSPEAAARLREALGLNRPLVVQYVEWLGARAAGRPRRLDPVRRAGGPLIVSRLPVTLPLTLHGRAAHDAHGAAAGPLRGHAPPALGRLPGHDRVAARHRAPVVLGGAAAHLVVLRAPGLGAIGRLRRAGRTALWPGVRSLLLPAVALGLFQTAVLVRATRSAVLDVLREDYVRTARAKGVRERSVVVKHTLRNALIPIVTVAGIQLGQLMAGSIILESVFALPGLGRLALGAITARDLPVVQGVTALRRLVASCCINFLVDLPTSSSIRGFAMSTGAFRGAVRCGGGRSGT